MWRLRRWRGEIRRIQRGKFGNDIVVVQQVPDVMAVLAYKNEWFVFTRVEEYPLRPPFVTWRGVYRPFCPHDSWYPCMTLKAMCEHLRNGDKVAETP